MKYALLILYIIITVIYLRHGQISINNTLSNGIICQGLEEFMDEEE